MIVVIKNCNINLFVMQAQDNQPAQSVQNLGFFVQFNC
jgi:hypothetical protein